jgi:hypothetical protein
MAENAGNDVRQQLFQLLLDKVEEDQYPSSTMLDQIERLLTPDEVEAYAGVLLTKVDGDTYPSNSLIRRIMQLAGV